MNQNDFYLLKKLAQHHNQVFSSQISNQQSIKSLVSSNLINKTAKQHIILTTKGHHALEQILSKKLNPVFAYAFKLVDLLILLFVIIFGFVIIGCGITYTTFGQVVLCIVSVLLFYSLLIPYLIEKYYKHRYNVNINKYIKYFQ